MPKRLPEAEYRWLRAVARELGQPVVVPETHWQPDSERVLVVWLHCSGVKWYADLAGAREKIRRSPHPFCYYADLDSGELLMLEPHDPAPGNSD